MNMKKKRREKKVARRVKGIRKAISGAKLENVETLKRAPNVDST